MVEVAPQLIVADITLNGLSPGTYYASVRATGDITDGAASTGGMWAKGDFGAIEVGEDGMGSVLVDKEVEIWEMIGRSMVVGREKGEEGRRVENGRGTLVGVVARSAGVWENTKVVCVKFWGGGRLLMIGVGLLVLGEEYLGGENAECGEGDDVRWCGVIWRDAGLGFVLYKIIHRVCFCEKA